LGVPLKWCRSLLLAEVQQKRIGCEIWRRWFTRTREGPANWWIQLAVTEVVAACLVAAAFLAISEQREADRADRSERNEMFRADLADRRENLRFVRTVLLSGARGEDLDFSNLDLQGSEMRGFVLAGANLNGTFLQKSKLINTDLRGTQLSRRGPRLGQSRRCRSDQR
jgi:uncharacterized protein YjbI with pentapeptide repeats